MVGVVGADGPSLYPCEASHREPPDKALSHSFFWEISGFFFSVSICGLQKVFLFVFPQVLLISFLYRLPSVVKTVISKIL